MEVLAVALLTQASIIVGNTEKAQIMAYSPLTPAQIQQLTAQGCSASDWTSVSVNKQTDISRIRNIQFIGSVNIGTNSGSISCDGAELPCGLYNATVAQCNIGDNVRIAHIGSTVTNYSIESNVLIQDVAALVVDGKGNFGNGVELDVVNEGGGRGTKLLNDLTAQVAYLQAMERHDGELTKKLSELIDKKVNAVKSEKGVIATGARIVHCGTVRNVNIGPYASIHGAVLLDNGTILSCQEHLSEIGEGVNAVSFILSEGAKVTGGAILDKVFVGQGTKLGKQYSAENSLFFANCEGFHGEAVSLFGGPYTVTHHKSTLLIAGLFSFYNAGSGSNQSNHMYKLGPVHQGIFERGSKTGSFSYVLHETHVGAFSVVIGKHYTNINTPNLPFSYIFEEDGGSKIVPGMNLFSVGTVRDGEKWPKRDNRKAPKKRDLIIFDVFSPYSVEKMRKGRKDLLALSESTPREKTSVLYGGVQLSRLMLKKGAKFYSQAIVRYLYEKVSTRLIDVLGSAKNWKEATARLTSHGELKSPAEWTDLAGLLVPRERVTKLEDDIRSGAVASYDALLQRLQSIYDSYRNDEWEFVIFAFTQEFGVAPAALTQADMLKVIDMWVEASNAIHGMILDDSKKEFGAFARIGFGLDRTEEEQNRDFEAVRGSAETNSVVQKLVKEAEEFKQRTAKYKELVAAVAE